MHSKFSLYTPHVPSSLYTPIIPSAVLSSKHKTISSSMSLEEKFDALMKSYETIASSNQELENQNAYLRHQIEETEKQTKKPMKRPSGSVHGDDGKSNSYLSSSSHEEPHRRSRGGRRPSTNFDDFKVEILESEGKLDPNEFIEWLNTVGHIIQHTEVPNKKKVKLVTLKLRKYTSLWWTNLCAKRVRNRKEKICSWEKMKVKLKSCLLPSSYLQDRYSKLHNLFHGSMSVEDYTREFEKLLIECDS